MEKESTGSSTTANTSSPDPFRTLELMQQLLKDPDNPLLKPLAASFAETMSLMQKRFPAGIASLATMPSPFEISPEPIVVESETKPEISDGQNAADLSSDIGDEEQENNESSNAVCEEPDDIDITDGEGNEESESEEFTPLPTLSSKQSSSFADRAQNDLTPCKPSRSSSKLEDLSPEMISPVAEDSKAEQRKASEVEDVVVIEHHKQQVVLDEQDKGKAAARKLKITPKALENDIFLLVSPGGGSYDDEVSSGAISECTEYDDDLSVHSVRDYETNFGISGGSREDRESVESETVADYNNGQEDNDSCASSVESQNVKQLNHSKEQQQQHEEIELDGLLEEIEEEQYHLDQLVKKDLNLQDELASLISKIRANQGKIMSSQARLSNMYQNSMERRNLLLEEQLGVSVKRDKQLCKVEVQSTESDEKSDHYYTTSSEVKKRLVTEADISMDEYKRVRFQ